MELFPNDPGTLLGEVAVYRAWQCVAGGGEAHGYVEQCIMVPGVPGLVRELNGKFSVVQPWQRFFDCEKEARECVADDLYAVARGINRVAAAIAAGGNC